MVETPLESDAKSDIFWESELSIYTWVVGGREWCKVGGILISFLEFLENYLLVLGVC